MKNNEEFRNSVFEKASAYEKCVKRRRWARIRILIAVFACLAIAVPAVGIPVTISMGNRATAGMTTQQTSDTESSTAAETSKSETTSTTASTTIAFTTRIDAFTTTLAHTSTTSVGSTAMPSVTPGSGIFFNGAYSVKISYNEEYEDGYSACVAWERTEETYGNFNDHFFDKNALILIKFNTGTGETAPCFLDIDISKSGKMIVDIGLSASDEAEACTWLMMIPIPRENIADVTEITVRFSNMYTE